MTKTILMLLATALFGGLAAAQPDGRMAPGSGSGSAPGTGATAPDYEETQEPKSNPQAGSGSTGRGGEEPRGSIGAGRMEPGGSGAGTTSPTTMPRAPR
jgi:hypothetical protein